MDIMFFMLFVLAIIISSAVISCSEAALLSVSYTKAKEIATTSKSGSQREKMAKNLLIVKEGIQKYISTIVVLNNVVNIVGSVYVGVIATQVFGSEYLGLVSGILTFLIIMFSEIIPKIIGEQNSEAISLRVSGILLVLTKLLTPVIYILDSIARFFVKIRKENQISEGEIREMAALGHEEGSLNQYESEVISNVFRADELDVYEVMVPKNKVILLDIEDNFEETIKVFSQTGFTRFPVKKDGEIVGVINIKDLFQYHKRENKFSIQKILRPIIFAPEQMKLFTLEKKLKNSRIHMAVIVNEHGDFTGIVTLEDIIEEVLGEIEDEFDSQKELITKISDKKYKIKGDCDLEDLNDVLGIELPIEGDFTTLNGFLISKLDGIARVNQKVKINEGQFRVIASSKRKVLEVELILH